MDQNFTFAGSWRRDIFDRKVTRPRALNNLLHIRSFTLILIGIPRCYIVFLIN